MNATGPTMEGEVVAFFDVDHTLIDANPASRYARHALAQGEIGLRAATGTLWAMATYRLGWTDAAPWIQRAVANLRGMDVEVFRERCEALYAEVMSVHLLEGAVACVRDHQRRGERVVLVTASLHTVVQPLADHLQVDAVVANRVCVEGGVLTGDLVPPICYGPGKLPLAQAWAAAHQIDLRDCWFYTDSSSDLALLEAVGRPVVVHPDPRLERFARLRGWPIREFRASAIGSF